MDAKLFVDRYNELQMLKKEFEQVFNSARGTTILVKGVAGIGKTSFLDHFCSQLDKSDLIVARTRCNATTTTGSAYRPFVDLLSKQEAWAKKTTDLFFEVGPEWAKMIPIAGTLVSASIQTAKWVFEDSATADFEASSRMQKRFLDFIEKTTKNKMILITIDDIQWLDPLSMELWVALAEKTRHCKLMLVCSYREDISITNSDISPVLDKLVSEGTAKTIHLRNFTEDAVRDFLRENLNVSEVPTSCVIWIAKTSGGNPLLLSNLASYLIERGAIRTQYGQLVFTPPVEEIPQDIVSIINQRLRYVSDDEKRVLYYASVQGEEFLSVILSDELKSDETVVIQKLKDLSGRYEIVFLLSGKSGPISDTYAFIHRIVWQACYQQLTPRERALLHRSVAESSEVHLSEIIESDTEKLLLLAKHWELAGEPVKAAAYYLKATKRAVAAYAYNDAIYFRQKGLELLAQQKILDKSTSRLKLDLMSVMIVRLIQESKAGVTELQQMKQLATELDDKTSLGNIYMLAYWLGNVDGKVGEALSSAQAARVLRSTLRDKIGECEAIVAVCKMKARSGRLPEVLADYELATKLYKEAVLGGQKDEDAWVFFYLNRSYALALSDLGYYERSIKLLKSSVSKAVTLNNWFQHVEALAHLTEQYIFIGQYELAKEAALLGVKSAEGQSTGKWQKLECQLHLAMLNAIDGNYTKALVEFQQGHNEATSQGSTGWWEIVYAKRQIARLWLLVDPTVNGADKALSIAQSLISLSKERGFVHGLVQGLAESSLASFLLNRRDEAQKASEEAIRLLRKHVYLVATPSEEVLYIRSKILGGIGLIKEARDLLSESDLEVQRKAGFFINKEWKETYITAVAKNREMINALFI